MSDLLTLEDLQKTLPQTTIITLKTPGPLAGKQVPIKSLSRGMRKLWMAAENGKDPDAEEVLIALSINLSDATAQTAVVEALNDADAKYIDEIMDAIAAWNGWKTRKQIAAEREAAEKAGTGAAPEQPAVPFRS